jgi:hypothetical protein
VIQLALHILDIVENSTRAGAKLITVVITENRQQDLFRIDIEDDGCGMSDEELSHVLDPFYTTKKVRRVGLGLPLLCQAAQQCGGRFDIVSKEGRGTKVRAEFRHGHLDRQPVGDIAGVVTALIAGNPAVDFVYSHRNSDQVALFDTREIRREIEGVPINHHEVLKFIHDKIEESLEEIGIKNE